VQTTKAAGIGANKLLIEASKNDFDIASGQTLALSTPNSDDGRGQIPDGAST